MKGKRLKKITKILIAIFLFSTVFNVNLLMALATQPINISSVQKVEKVTANPQEGEVVSGTAITLTTSTTGAAIYFTTDENVKEPDILYTTPIVIDKETTIKAKAVMAGMEDSDISVFKYKLKTTNGIKIGEARNKVKGSTVTVRGVVTFADGNNSSIQDDTAGINIYAANQNVSIGDMIEVTGQIDEYNGLLQIKTSESQITVISSNNQLPSPKLINIQQAKSEDYESQLVKLENVTLGQTNPKTNYTPISDDTGNVINIFKMPKLTDIKEGDKVNVTAIATQFKEYQLRVRSAVDIEKVHINDVIKPVIVHTPVTYGNVNIDLNITASITDNYNVAYAKLFYRMKEQSEYKSLNMAKTNGEYSVSISSKELIKGTLEYYIEASDGINISTSPVDKNKPYEVNITEDDITGPDIIEYFPQSGSNTGSNRRPAIKVKYSDKSGVDFVKGKLYLDDTDITASAFFNENEVTYIPDKDLNIGEHKVKIVISDKVPNKPNIKEFTWNFFVGEEVYNLYFGQLHSHTSYSDGEGTPEEAYIWARDNAKADFFAITDHSNSFDSDLDWTKSIKWKNLKEIADKYNKDGSFVAIAGFEMTWSGSTGGWGHINTFNTEWFESRNNSKMDLKTYYERISKDVNSISQLNHPGKTFGDFNDFGFYTPEVDNVVKLVEVGNGEGPIRGSGYFPSYDYYTRALDKGWHLAPSNNQDNHKGKWITANDARTVILAPSLTRENIYEAIRKMRVYATEDKNLKIYLTANNKQMGSFLDNPDKLNFKIKVTDPDVNEKVGKISIISNGGIVVAAKEFNTNNAEWEFELDPENSYYYVRVDQPDKDIAVTAPVWTGKNVSAGISKMTVSHDIAVLNTNIKVTAGIYNNNQSSISNATLEFFVNSISPENKIGGEIINSIGSGETKDVSIVWTPGKTGTYKIYAKAVIEVNGVKKAFTESVSINVVEKDEIVKIVIDAGHQNQYVNGSYKDKIRVLSEILKSRKYMIYMNQDELNDDDLKDARLLILTDPQSKDDGKNNLKKYVYTDSEINAIRNFVNNGGSIIITSAADYKDAEGEYGNSAQGNKVLEAVNSNLRFNDDQVIDKIKNGGQEYRLYFDKLDSKKYNLVKDIEEGAIYSNYSGCSVLLKDNGDNDKVDWIVKGHETTESVDADNQNDKKTISKGDVYVLAVEELSNGSKVIVGGSTFFSDFEMTGDNVYANKKLTENIIQWAAKPKEPDLKKISEVRIDADKNGIPDLLGKKFAVEGVVTSQSVAVEPKNGFFDVIYIQDETAGITVFGVSQRPLKLGTRVKVVGRVDQYDGDTEIQIENEETDVIVIDTNLKPIEPKLMSTGDSMREENEGLLVKVKGKVTKITENALFVDDGTGEARVYVNGYIGDGTGDESKRGKWDNTIKVGSLISAVGLVSEDPEGHRLRVRNTAEIVKISDVADNKIAIRIVDLPSQFKNGKDAAVTIEAENKTAEAQKVTIIVALYEKKTNTFLSYGAACLTLKTGDKAELTGMVNIPLIGEYVVKCFVWDTISSGKSRSDVIEIPVVK